jgi:hypothetical protein
MRRKILVMVKPVASFLVGIEQTIMSDLVGGSGGQRAETNGCHTREQRGSHVNFSDRSEPRHGLFPPVGVFVLI